MILGRVRKLMGDRDGALEAYLVAVEIFRGTGNRDYEGIALNDIGTLYRDQGRYREAEIYHKQALRISRELTDRDVEGSALHSLGMLYFDQGRYDEALEVYQQSLTIQRELGNRAEEA